MVNHVRGSGAPGLESASSLVSGDVRRHNLELVAGHLVEHGPSSRSQIADGTGLTRGAVTALTRLLVEAGTIREVEPVSAGGKGRPQTLLELAADDVALVALQLDADEATAVLASLAGDVLFRHSEHHGRPMGDPEPVLDVLAAVLERAVAAAGGMGRRVVDVTVVVFAPVLGNPPMVFGDSDMGWGEVDVLDGLRKRVPGLPESLSLHSDAGFAAMAEFDLLPGVKDMVYLKSNSGIGGAVILDGRLLTGAHSLAGGFGHLPMDHQGERCVCGQRGCLVLVAGPDVVLKSAGLGEELESLGLGSALGELTERIARGDARAVEAFDAAADWVARALHVISRTLDPQTVVLGGYWSVLADRIARSFAEHAPISPSPDSYLPTIRAGQLENDATLLGAIRESRKRLLREPLEVRLI
ncbi:transcriptional regulator [Arthrobacter sp. StoSoilB3]|jgi:predicted NBD/HSP70 family sugar kinase|uniref:NBD/HSP70 family sugar kinase n=1 Tax=Paenarthrobacter nicotinovorans TaxID=29320 RepID=A0ABT9TR68_PAENI|nr:MULTISPECIES: ROK family protein [Paenarthrobacter]MDI2021103.1 Protein mlc [Paenarthrobacter nicotinovorans]MDQ0104176.1 putative NBD/HSP70 family sugar kinase [Paenarthrobacter nicotinovorans]QOT23268.1 ROK family protein [Paenarthrobacter sp. YJN-D]BCW42184.1 transcriptional regulator [Arthrobacter sp. StoSoilB3]